MGPLGSRTGSPRAEAMGSVHRYTARHPYAPGREAGRKLTLRIRPCLLLRSTEPRGSVQPRGCLAQFQRQVEDRTCGPCLLLSRVWLAASWSRDADVPD